MAGKQGGNSVRFLFAINLGDPRRLRGSRTELGAQRHQHTGAAVAEFDDPDTHEIIDSSLDLFRGPTVFQESLSYFVRRIEAECVAGRWVGQARSYIGFSW